jgi:hypothetical protein
LYFFRITYFAQCAIFFIAAIETLPYAVTKLVFKDTPVVVTLEFVSLTYYSGAVAFIRHIATVIVTIADVKHRRTVTIATTKLT